MKRNCCVFKIRDWNLSSSFIIHLYWQRKIPPPIHTSIQISAYGERYCVYYNTRELFKNQTKSSSRQQINFENNSAEVFCWCSLMIRYSIPSIKEFEKFIRVSAVGLKEISSSFPVGCGTRKNVELSPVIRGLETWRIFLCIFFQIMQ